MGAALLGLLFGTMMQYLFHLGMVGKLRLCLGGAIAAMFFSGVFAINCYVPPLVGVETQYPIIPRFDKSSSNDSGYDERSTTAHPASSA